MKPFLCTELDVLHYYVLVITVYYTGACIQSVLYVEILNECLCK